MHTTCTELVAVCARMCSGHMQSLWVTSYLPLISRLTRHVGSREAPEAVLHRGPPEGVSHVPRRGIRGQGHGVLRVVVQIVVVREQRRLVKAAVVGGVRNQIRCVLHVPSAGDSRNILDDHASLWKEKEHRIHMGVRQTSPLNPGNAWPSSSAKLQGRESLWNTLLPPTAKIRLANLGTQLADPC